jgi:predicted DNA-binding transcriptional regulator YafY
MTRPTARVLALLEILERGGTRTAAELASELGVDERTARRYVEHLIEIGVPVASERGRYGGFRLTAGERMPPLMLDEEEALAVTLGLLAARRSGLTAGGEAAETAMRKVRGSLPRAVAGRLEAVLEGAAFTDAGAPTASASPVAETRVLLLLASAIRNRRPVWFRYSSREGRDTARTLAPYGIVAHSGRWYATGHDSLSAELRTFRLDRMSELSLLPGSFDVPAGFDPAAAVVESLAATPWRHEVSVLVEGPADGIRSALPRGLATVEPAEPAADGRPRSRVLLRAERLDWVPAALAGLDGPFAVERPAELRERVRALGERLLRAADPAPSAGDEDPSRDRQADHDGDDGGLEAEVAAGEGCRAAHLREHQARIDVP